MERTYCFLLFLALAGAALTKSTRQTGRPTLKYDPAQPCDDSKCKLPDCLCASTKIPRGLTPEQTPQIITISFSAGLRVEDYNIIYSKVFTANRTNPNGCPIGVTFFATHNYTDYSLMDDLYHKNPYEMADNTITRREPPDWWRQATVDELTNEIRGQAVIEHWWGNIPNVYGYRAPYLMSSENGLQVLYQNHFTYDASMPTTEPYWPFTLDYKSPLCNYPAVCPQNSYPGLWVIPNIDYTQDVEEPCNVLRSCNGPNTEEEWYKFLMDNFYVHYNSPYRPPFGLYAESAWFYDYPGAKGALMSFLDKMQGLHDVYIVTHNQLIEWVQTPTVLSQLDDFDPWKCPKRPPPGCSYQSPSCNHYYNDYKKNFRSCKAPCPPNWPHYGNPYGD